MFICLIVSLLLFSRAPPALAKASNTESVSTDAPAASDPSIQTPATGDDPLFCFIVRTYWGHDDDHGGSLRKFITSLQRQNHQRWEAVLLIADSRPFKGIQNLINDLGDDRVWVFAEWISSYFAPKEKGEWREGYHGMLFNLTDDAIQVCPPDTQWLVVTNGDNLYADGFLDRALQEINAAPETPDIVAFDFYSRFLRPTAPACLRFSPQGEALCKRNRLRWCHTDLGANILNWDKLTKEHRKFGTMDVGSINPAYRDLDEAHHDGVLMEYLVAGGWRVVHVHDTCMFNHAPSPQQCALSGGVWDDRDIVTGGGGTCLSTKEADAVMEASEQVESVFVNVVNDGHTAAFHAYSNNNADQQLTLRCLRMKSYGSEEILGQAMLWFSDLCADDDLDLPTFNATLATFYPNWEELVAFHPDEEQQEEEPEVQADDSTYDPYMYGDEL